MVKINLVGQIFGKLRVIKPAPKNEYICKCECGNFRTVKAEYLRRGFSKMCEECKTLGQKQNRSKRKCQQ